MSVKAFGPRIGVVDPPTERVRASGLIVISSELEVMTGVVLSNPAVDAIDEDPNMEVVGAMFGQALGAIVRDTPALRPGVLVYYAKDHGVRIGDITIIDLGAILAYDAD
jgi:hypothetical protein